MPWYWHVLELAVGALLGFFGAALCAMGRCSDCETIGRIWKGGQDDPP